MKFYLQIVLAFGTSYLVTCFICEIMLKITKKRDENYGGDGSLKCSNCKKQLSFMQTINLTRCPNCKAFW